MNRPDSAGQAWTGLDRLGQAWTGLDRLGQAWTGWHSGSGDMGGGGHGGNRTLATLLVLLRVVLRSRKNDRYRSLIGNLGTQLLPVSS